MRRIKKVVSIFLVVFLLILSCNSFAKSNDDTTDNKDGNLQKDITGTKLQGSTTSTTATTGIGYKTDSFNARFEINGSGIFSAQFVKFQWVGNGDTFTVNMVGPDSVLERLLDKYKNPADQTKIVNYLMSGGRIQLDANIRIIKNSKETNEVYELSDDAQYARLKNAYPWDAGTLRDFSSRRNLWTVFDAKLLSPIPSPSPTPSINLKAQINDVPDEVYAGSKVSITATAICTGSNDPVLTTAVWTVNGVEAARGDSFVLKGQRKSTFSLTVPKGKTVVKFIINPDKKQPPNETTYNDNTAQVSITGTEIPPSSGGGIEVTVVKADGTNTLAVHPQWVVDSTQRLQGKGASWDDAFSLGKVNKSSYPSLAGHWNETVKFDYLNKTLVLKAKQYNVTVRYRWSQTYHKEWKVTGSHKETVTDYKFDKALNKWIVSGSHQISVSDYGMVNVPDPIPSAHINVSTETSGKYTTQIAYNIISGEDAEISTEQRTSSHKETAVIAANTSHTFTYVLPAYSQVYQNKYNYFDSGDDGVAYIRVTASASVPSRSCSACGSVISYVPVKTVSEVKNIIVKACSVYSKSAHLGWDN